MKIFFPLLLIFFGLLAGAANYPAFSKVMIRRTTGESPLMTNQLPEGVTAEKFAFPEGSEYVFVSPLEQTNRAGETLKRLVFEALKEDTAIEDKSVPQNDEPEEQAVIGDARLGTKVSDAESGLSMLVPLGWKEKKSVGTIFYFSATHGDDGLSEYLEVRRLKRPQGAEAREMALQEADQLAGGRLGGGFRDFDLELEHSQGSGWKVMIRRIGPANARLAAILGMIEEPARQEIDEPVCCQFLFVFGETRLVNYNVIFDAMIESAFFDRPGVRGVGL